MSCCNFYSDPFIPFAFTCLTFTWQYDLHAIYIEIECTFCFRNFNESDFCILFMLLTYPVWAKMHKLEEPDKVGCQSVNDIAMKLIAADCSVRQNVYPVLHSYNPMQPI